MWEGASGQRETGRLHAVPGLPADVGAGFSLQPLPLMLRGWRGQRSSLRPAPPRAPSSLLASPLHWPQLPPPSLSQHPPSRSAPATAPLLSQVSSAPPPSRTHRFTDPAARAFTQQDTPFLEGSKRRRNRKTFLVLLHLYYLLEDLRSKASVWPRRQSIRSLSHQSLSYPLPCPQGEASRQATGPCFPLPAPRPLPQAARQS